MEDLLQQRKVEAANYFENLLRRMVELEEGYKLQAKERTKLRSDLYFSDGVRRIDFVFVFNNKTNKNNNAKEFVNKFIQNLEAEGVNFEESPSKMGAHLVFIKVHVTRNALLMYSLLMNYEPFFMRTPDPPIPQTRIINLPFMETDLSRKEPFSDVVQRASESSLGNRPKDLTSAERLMIAGELFKNIRFGNRRHEIGILYLIKKKYLTAYPTHDRPSHWSLVGPLNERQLLCRYWARMRMVFKYQPLHLIHKYYGPEIAFYFAFVGFYNRMLIPIAILGTCTIFYGLLTSGSQNNPFSEAICKSDQVFCPLCQSSRICSFRPVSDDCVMSKRHYSIDNMCSLIYSIIVCFWTTIVSQLWKRRETVLRYEWNLLNIEQDNTVLAEYRKHATHKRVNRYTGAFEYYIPESLQSLKLCISCICCGIMCLLVAFGVLGTIIFRLSIVYWLYSPTIPFLGRHILTISHVTSTVVLFIYMMVFDSIYKVVAEKLTAFETPRTQQQYDRSCILKLHIVTMINGYAYLYYTAFFRGSFRTYPGDDAQFHSLGLINNDVDSMMGGMVALFFQLSIIFSGKTFSKMVFELSEATIMYILRTRRVQKLYQIKGKLTSWEKGYLLNKTNYSNITMSEYKTIILQFGYLVIFPLAFPIGPLIALIANVIEIRFDAIKLTLYTQRHIPIRVAGIGAWNSILNALSYIGIVTNCFLIAFASNFIFYFRAYYYMEKFDLINATFSVFDVLDYSNESNFYGTTSPRYCLYKGLRYPPWHPKKYEHTKQYWEMRSYQLLVVIILEAGVLGFHKLLTFAIPSMPSQIKERIRLRRRKENIAREQQLAEKFKAGHHTRTSLAREEIYTRLRQIAN